MLFYKPRERKLREFAKRITVIAVEVGNIAAWKMIIKAKCPTAKERETDIFRFTARKNQAIKKWHSRAMLIDLSKMPKFDEGLRLPSLLRKEKGWVCVDAMVLSRQLLLRLRLLELVRLPLHRRPSRMYTSLVLD